MLINLIFRFSYIFVITFMSVSCMATRLDNTLVEKYIKNLQKVQNESSEYCKNVESHSIDLLTLIIAQSKEIKEKIVSNESGKCDLYAIDAVIADFKNQLSKIDNSIDNKISDYNQEKQLKICEFSRKTMMSILNKYTGVDFEKCLYSSINSNKIIDPIAKSNDQFDIDELDLATKLIAKFDSEKYEQDLEHIKASAVMLDKQLIEVLVFQMKNPKRFEQSKMVCSIQNISGEVTSLLKKIKQQEICLAIDSCTDSSKGKIISTIKNIQNEISVNDYPKCLRSLNL